MFYVNITCSDFESTSCNDMFLYSNTSLNVGLSVLDLTLVLRFVSCEDKTITAAMYNSDDDGDDSVCNS